MYSSLRASARIALLLTFSLEYATAAAQPAAKPNVIFILADDQSFDTIRALGNRDPHAEFRQARCPRITFTHAYNMGRNKRHFQLKARFSQVQRRELQGASELVTAITNGSTMRGKQNPDISFIQL